MCVCMSQILQSPLVHPVHRMLQGHVLRSGERQSVCAVMVDQLGNTREDAATLVQGEAQTLNALSLGHDDVHTALTGPDETKHTHTYTKTWLKVLKRLNRLIKC